MARTKSKKPGSAQRKLKKEVELAPAKAAEQQPSLEPEPLRRDESTNAPEVLVADDDDEEEKGDVETELERLVFGDSVGFREGLRNFAGNEGTAQNALVTQEEEDDEGGLEGIADSDLFFTDLGPGAPNALDATADSDEDEDVGLGQPAAWQDSDDERLVVSLASVPRLRKLRRTEAEDVISGKEYVKRLRRQFELLHPLPDWAVEATQRPAKKRRLNGNADATDPEDSSMDEMDVDDDELSADPLAKLLQDVNGLVRRSDTGVGKKRKLRPETLDIQRTKDIEGVQASAITSLSFHPEYPLLLSSGPSSTLYLHHIAPSPPAPSANPLLTSLHVKGTPLTTTAFHPVDTRIFLSARRRYFHVWDLESGKIEKIARIYGQQHEQKSMERFKLSPDGRHMALVGSARKGGGVINILDAHTLQWASQVRIESRGGIAEFEWWSDSKGLCVIGKNGEVTEWNLQLQRVTARWQDEGAVGTTTISLGGNNGHPASVIGQDRWVAVGSSSGIVNIYDRRAWLTNPTNKTAEAGESPVPAFPKPTKTLDHLTTPTSHLIFSPDGQLLIMASRWKKDALRMVHLPSCTVYRNWPTSTTPLGRITGVAFGPGSDVLAVANEAGKIRLWEIRA